MKAWCALEAMELNGLKQPCRKWEGRKALSCVMGSSFPCQKVLFEVVKDMKFYVRSVVDEEHAAETICRGVVEEPQWRAVYSTVE